MIRNIVETIGSFTGRGQNLGERLIESDHRKKLENAMQIAQAIGGVANSDLMYERPEAETTLLCFKEILHDNDLVVAQWPAGWQALQSYFGE